MRNNKRCACGIPLHYTDPTIEAMTTKMVEEQGEWMLVTVENNRYMVQRHYIALHGLKGNELESLLEKGIVRRG